MDNEFFVNSILSYRDLFINDKLPNVRAILSVVSRETLLQWVFKLSSTYENCSLDKIFTFFSDDNPYKKIIKTRLRIFEKEKCHNCKYVLYTHTTILELLRIIFSISPRVQQNNNIDPYKFEFELFKTILYINQKTSNCIVSQKDKNNISKLLYIHSLSRHQIEQNSFHDQFVTQMYLSVMFFKQIELDKRYQEIYNLFLERVGIKDWREYVRTIFYISTFIKINNNSQYIKNQMNLLNINVMNYLSIYWKEGPIAYSATNEFDRTGNSDYRYFREKPFIKLTKDKYMISNVGFVVDKLFNGLYFDFVNIARSKKNDFAQKIRSFFTEGFIEKTVFATLLKSISNSLHYTISLSDTECKKIDNYSPPDFYLRNQENSVVILFECKDIKINAWVKEQRDMNLIEKHIKNKLLRKTFNITENKEEKVDNPKGVGVGQLVDNMKRIRKQEFKWDRKVFSGIKIYPVLVISDMMLITYGFSQIMNNWYRDLFPKNIMENRPLIVMSLSCLIRYNNLFRNNGFEYYFELYYLFLKTNTADNIKGIIKNNMSFDEYMSTYFEYDVFLKENELWIKNEILKNLD